MTNDHTALIAAIEERVQELFLKHATEITLIGKKVFVIKKQREFMEDIFSYSEVREASDGLLSDILSGVIDVHTFGNWRRTLKVQKQDVRIGRDGIVKDTTKIGSRRKRYS